MLTIYLCIEKTLGKKLTKYHNKCLFLWICTLFYLSFFCGKSQQKISLDINECQLLRPLEQSAHRSDSYWIYFEYRGKRWTQKNCWPSCSHVIRSFTLFPSVILSISLYPWWPCLSLCDYFFFFSFFFWKSRNKKASYKD